MSERTFSLPWTQESPELYVAFSYSISRNGWHDSSHTMERWELRYQGTIIHTGSGLGGDDVRECKIEADRHRGISNPGGIYA